MEKISFILNYSSDERDIIKLKACEDKSKLKNNYCTSVKVFNDKEKNVEFSEIYNLALEEIKERGYTFKTRKFSNKELEIGDIGILREISDETNVYKIKITGLLKENGDYNFDKNAEEIIIDEKVKNYIEEMTEKPFKLIEFEVLKIADNLKTKITIQGTLNKIRDINLIENLENENWIDL